LVSQKNLTDEDGPYIEVQSGPLPRGAGEGPGEIVGILRLRRGNFLPLSLVL